MKIVKLKDCCTIKPPKAEARKRLKETDLVSFVPMNNLGINKKDLVLDAEKQLSEVTSSYTYFADNDVLLAKITPCFENGKLGIAKGLTNGIGFGSSEFIVFRPNEGLLSEYLYYFLLRPIFREEGAAVMTGAVGHKRVPKEFIENTEIPLPSLDEQKRIVAILDQSFADIEKARETAKKNLANSKELFESCLQRTFSGSHDGWATKSLKSITSKIGSGATPRGGKAAYKSEGISLVRSMNVHDRQFFEKDLAFIDEKQASKLDNVQLSEGDVLLNITGASVARCCLIQKEYLPARVNQHVSIIRVKSSTIEPELLCFLLTSKYYKDILLGIGEAGSTRQAITKAQIESFEVTYPNELDEQRDLINMLSSFETDVLTLTKIYNTKIEALNELKSSMLQQAFTGELTKSKGAA